MKRTFPEEFGEAERTKMTNTRYETDIVAWSQQQAQLLRDEAFELVDWNNIIEEIESLGISQQHELDSRLTVLLMHLLKWQFQASHRSRSWEVTIGYQRVDIDGVLERNPSLRASFSDFVRKAYPRAVKKAVIETRLPVSTFPTECSYTLGQIMDEAYFPEEFGEQERAT